MQAGKALDVQWMCSDKLSNDLDTHAGALVEFPLTDVTTFVQDQSAKAYRMHFPAHLAKAQRPP